MRATTVTVTGATGANDSRIHIAGEQQPRGASRFAADLRDIAVWYADAHRRYAGWVLDLHGGVVAG